MGNRRINLLPAEERQKVSRERGLMYALLALIVVIGVLGGLYVLENQSKSDKQVELDGLTAQIAELDQQVAVLKPYEQAETQRLAMSQTATQIYDSRVTWSSIVEEISLLIPETCQLTQLQAAVPANMLAGSSLGGATTAAAGGADITFTGNASTQRDVAEFMTRLGLMPQLMNIQLVSSQKSTSTGTSGQTVISFTITALLRPFQSAVPLAVPAATTGGTGQ